MGYRDELDAARARSAALEQELASKDSEIDQLEDKLTDKKEREKAARHAQRRQARRSFFSNWGVWVVVSVVMMAGVGGGVVWCISSLSQKVNGQFTATGAQLGNQTIAVDGCDSGQRHDFRGVDLFGGGLRFRFLETLTKGPVLAISRGDEKLALLGKQQCKTLSASVSKTNTTVNNVRLVEGSVEIDCVLPQGGTLTGKVTFENCR